MNENNKRPLFSIISATYNAATTLNDLVQSILPQKTENVELIIVDGGSTDDTVNIIKSYGSIVDYYITEKDNGIYDAWNKGIKVAKGQWIMFVGADDVLLPNTIENYNQLILNCKDKDVDYISGKVCYVNDNGKIMKLLGSECSWNKMRKGMCAAHVASLHNSNLFDEVGLYDLKFKICGDYELLLRKKEKLKSLFLNKTVAQMKSGGMSFSFAAIIETYQIRKTRQSLSRIQNVFIFIRDIVGYYLFRLKHSFN